jgi:hypothetical protein
MKRFLLVGAVMVAGVLGLGSPAAKADPLTLNGIDDLSSFNLTVKYTYDSTLKTGHMEVTYFKGSTPSDWTLWPSVSNHSGSPLNTYAPSGDGFHLDAYFNVATASSFTVTGGDLTVMGGGNTLYTSTNLVAFGYNLQSGNVGLAEWQFEFTQATGTYGSTTGLVGVDLHGGTSTGYKSGGIGSYNWDVINFTQDFDNTFKNNGSADTFVVVPLPKVAWMALAMPALLLLARRRPQPLFL